jgi:Leucine-rich repeat (LRR) protein
MDPAIARAIWLEVEHPEPFRDEELDNILSLGVRNARGIAGLERCRSLRVLVLSGYGTGDLPDLGGFAELSSLNVTDSDLRDIGSIHKMPSLLTLNVERSLVSDISGTLDCAGLGRLDVTGNPLSDASYREVIPELRAKGVDVRASDEREWSLTRALHAAGLPFAYYLHGNRHRLSRPGLTRTDTPEGGHIGITPEELEHLLTTSPDDIEPLFDDPTRISGQL